MTNIKFILFGLILLCLYSCGNRPTSNEVPQECPTTEFLEIPQSKVGNSGVLLKRIGYTLSFNTETNLPNWVAWKLNKERLIEQVSRAKHFYPDPDFSRDIAVETRDYSNSGWDRGHMCPAGDNRWDKEAMRESFYMTNICPQHHNLNRGDWKELEDNCRRWVEESGCTLYIVCGPILYNNSQATYIGKKHQIRVPEAFYKVILKKNEGGILDAIGFIYKNTAGNHTLDNYVNTVDDVERITGLDFFSALPDDVEDNVESTFNLENWR